MNDQSSSTGLLGVALRVLLVTLIIPMVGFFVGRSITGPWNEQARAVINVSMAEFCDAVGGSGDAQVKRACGNFGFGVWIERGSLWVAAIGLALVLVPLALARFAGSDRDRWLFRPIRPLVPVLSGRCFRLIPATRFG